MASVNNMGIYGLLLIISAVFAYVLVDLQYFPFLGVSLVLAGLLSLVYYFSPLRNLWHTVIYGAGLVFCLFLVLRSNPFLTFLNIAAILYSGSILVVGHGQPEHPLNFLITPIDVFVRSLLTKNKYAFDSKAFKNVQVSGWVGVIPQVVITIAILLVIVPLLSYANPLFDKLVQHFLETFNLVHLIQKLFQENMLVHWIRIVVFGGLALFIPGLLSYLNHPDREYPRLIPTWSLPSLLLPKIVVSGVLIIFFITQAQLYFASDETLQTLGYTNSRYAREVFGQLSVVALIIYSLIYSHKDRQPLSKFTTSLLIIEGIFLTLIAFKSDYDYSSNWGFTHKRLYGFAVATWILGVFSLFAFKYFNNLKNSLHHQHLIFLTMAILFAINIVNFDSLIYHNAKSTTHSGTDHKYLSQLSADARSYREHLAFLKSELEKPSEDSYKISSASYRVLNQIESLQIKYGTNRSSFRTFNFSEYWEYLSIKDVDVAAWRKTFDLDHPPPTYFYHQ